MSFIMYSFWCTNWLCFLCALGIRFRLALEYYWKFIEYIANVVVDAIQQLSGCATSFHCKNARPTHNSTNKTKNNSCLYWLTNITHMQIHIDYTYTSVSAIISIKSVQYIHTNSQCNIYYICIYIESITLQKKTTSFKTCVIY